MLGPREQRIVEELRRHPDARMREVGEKLSRVEDWRAEDLREVLREMLSEVRP